MDSKIGAPRNGLTPDSIGVCAIENCVVNRQSAKPMQRHNRGGLVCLSGFMGRHSVWIERCSNEVKLSVNDLNHCQFLTLS